MQKVLEVLNNRIAESGEKQFELEKIGKFFSQNGEPWFELTSTGGKFKAISEKTLVEEIKKSLNK